MPPSRSHPVVPALREATVLLRRQRVLLLALLGLMLLNRLAAMALPASSKFVIDEVIGRERGDLILPLAAAIAVAVLLEGATGFGLYRLTGIVSQQVITRLRTNLQAHVLRLPFVYFDDARSSALLSRIMADPETVRDVLGQGVVQIATGMLTALVAAMVLFSLDPQLTLIVLAVVSGFLVAMTKGFRRLLPGFTRVNDLTTEMIGRLADVLGGIKTVKTHRAERREAYAFTRESHRLLRAYARATNGAAVVVTASTLAASVINGMLLVLGAQVVRKGGMTLGDFVMYVFFVGQVLTPLLQIATTSSQVGHAIAALGRVAELRTVAREDEEDRGLLTLTSVNGRVVFDAVTFAYVPGRPVLRDVSFAVEPGRMVALVGPNGAGKTTLVQLLLRVRHPTQGRVLVDCQDLTGVRGRDYRAHVGLVPHDSVLFDGTIADNIRYGRPNASAAEVREAARLSHCDEFVSRLPAGYDTQVGSQGRRLSGGQRQRVAIARAILTDPRILVLDEAMALLDAESEVLVQNALRTLRRERTTFVIAHRLSAIRTADEVLMLDCGTVVEHGSHKDLLARQEHYWRLFQEQDRLRTAEYSVPCESSVGDRVA